MYHTVGEALRCIVSSAFSHTTALFFAASESVIELPFGSGDDPSATFTSTVHVTALSAVATLPSVTIRPVAQEDWVLLELAATWLEQGGFLEQVSLVYPDQRIALVVPQNAIAHVQVDHGACGVAASCGRLAAQQTQVIVQPFPSSPSPTQQRQWRVVPSRSDLVASSVAMERVAEAMGAGREPWPPAPPPKSVLVHPDVWKNSATGLARVRNVEGTGKAVVRVLTADDVPVDAIGTLSST